MAPKVSIYACRFLIDASALVHIFDVVREKASSKVRIIDAWQKIMSLSCLLGSRACLPWTLCDPFAPQQCDSEPIGGGRGLGERITRILLEVFTLSIFVSALGFLSSLASNCERECRTDRPNRFQQGLSLSRVQWAQTSPEAVAYLLPSTYGMGSRGTCHDPSTFYHRLMD